MEEINSIANKLLAAYNRELKLVRSWRHILQQQQEAITAGAWEELQDLIAAALPWREKAGAARQATRQLEGLLQVVTGRERPEWQDLMSLPAPLRQELAAAARQVLSGWDECRALQEDSLAHMQKALAGARAGLEQLQAARQVARAYSRGRASPTPRCLDRQF